MSSKRKHYSATFKLKVVLETYKNEKTMAQVASAYEIHVVQIHQWRKKFKEEGSSVFERKKDKEEQNHQQLVDELYKQIGQLKVERDWLKKKSEQIN